ncbi:MAG: sulfatase [Flavobacteriales bacterium]|nr:sulfatase [Flavobacteriales bacterium]
MNNLKKLSLGAISAIPLLSVAQTGERPNVIFIFTDDHATNAISTYNKTLVKTPNMDRLASEGMVMDNCFAVNSISTPSRACILTGKHSHKNGVTVFNEFDGSQQTFPKLLQKAGYSTAMIGKWHLTSDPTGFDYWNIFPGQGQYNSPILYTKDGGVRYKNGYATNVVADLTIDYIKSLPKDKPFFVMSQHKAPHRPFQPRPDLQEKYKGRTFPLPETFWDEYEDWELSVKGNKMSIAEYFTNSDLKITPPPGLPADSLAKWLATAPMELMVDGKKLTGRELVQYKYNRYMQDYLACVEAVDEAIGKVLDYLDQSGLAKNTIVIYSSDQGFFLGEHGFFDKRYMYEESIRMPFIIRWPGVIKAGTRCDKIVTNVDFAETFLDIAHVDIPSDMQGRSFVPLLRGEKVKDWPKSFYYRYYHDPNEHGTPAHYGVRTEDYKLIYYWRLNYWELFDLRKDKIEMVNVYNDKKYAKVRRDMTEELYRIKKEKDDNDELADAPLKSGIVPREKYASPRIIQRNDL